MVKNRPENVVVLALYLTRQLENLIAKILFLLNKSSISLQF